MCDFKIGQSIENEKAFSKYQSREKAQQNDTIWCVEGKMRSSKLQRQGLWPNGLIRVDFKGPSVPCLETLLFYKRWP